jgi:hypothetical protein
MKRQVTRFLSAALLFSWTCDFLDGFDIHDHLFSSANRIAFRKLAT